MKFMKFVIYLNRTYNYHQVISTNDLLHLLFFEKLLMLILVIN